MKKRILFVENNDGFRRFYKRALGCILPEYDIFFAYHGRDAINILNKHSKDFDLIISDFEMPVMNGIELYKELVASSKSYIPFLFLTSSKASLKDNLPDNGVPILSKPVDVVKFCDFVRETLEPKRVINPTPISIPIPIPVL